MKKLLFSLLLMIGLVQPSLAAAFVQGNTDRNFTSASIGVAFSSNVTSGNMIMGLATWLTTAGETLTSVAKTSGTATIGTVTIKNNPTSEGTSESSAMWYASVTGSGSLTMTTTVSAVVVLVGETIQEASGIDTFVSSAMQSQTHNNSGTDHLTSGTLTAGDYTFGVFVTSSAASNTFTAGTNFIKSTNEQLNNRWFTEYSTTSVTAAVGTETDANSDFVSGGMTFMLSSAATRNNLILLGVR